VILPAHVRRRRLALPSSGVEIALLDWCGEGPLALLHHANGFCGALWGIVAESLHPHFRVVAMDARGHGDSSCPAGAEAYRWDRFAEDVLEVARALAAETPAARVALGLGHSFGGTAMLAAASRAAGLFERLVLVDPVILPPMVVRAALGAEGRGNQLAEGARRRRHVFPSREEARATWQSRKFLAAWDPRALELYLQEGLRARADGQVELKCDPEIEATIFEAGGAFDIFALAPAVTAPVLLVWASQGNFPRAVYERLAGSMQHARIEALAAGHMVPMERPDLVSQAVLRFAFEPA
jgi:pimeloyl-ACP methyl ester carboxylesterase